MYAMNPGALMQFTNFAAEPFSETQPCHAKPELSP